MPHLLHKPIQHPPGSLVEIKPAAALGMVPLTTHTTTSCCIIRHLMALKQRIPPTLNFLVALGWTLGCKRSMVLVKTAGLSRIQSITVQMCRRHGIMGLQTTLFWLAGRPIWAPHGVVCQISLLQHLLATEPR